VQLYFTVGHSARDVRAGHLSNIEVS
jgi:hypothetical protein